MPVQAPQTTAPIQQVTPQANPQQQGTQQAFSQMTGSGVPVQTGMIPGAQGATAALGVVSNPAALMQQVMNQASQMMYTMSQFATQAMSTMGLGGIPQTNQVAMLSSLGNHMATQAMAMPAHQFANTAFNAIGNPLQVAFGNHILSHGFNRAQTEQMGSHFLSTLQQQPVHHWARQTLGSIGPQYFNQFDPRSLAAMPNQGLMPFGQQLIGNIMSQSPFQLGQQMLGSIPSFPQIAQNLGSGLMNMLPDSLKSTLGGGLQDLFKGNFAAAGESLLKGIGLPSLKDIGQKIFGSIPGLDKLPGGDLAQNLLGGIASGDLKGALTKGLGDFLGGKLLGPGGKLSEIGSQLLGKLGNGPIGQAASGIMDFIGKGKSLGDLGKGLLDKFGGKVLDKLGGFGKIASGALSLLNGDFTPAKALKMAANFIPGVGPIIAGLSAIPGIGGIVDGVFNGLGKVIEKIPGVSHVFKGISKVTGAIGKGVSKVVDGVKNVGKKLLGGAKKLISKI